MTNQQLNQLCTAVVETAKKAGAFIESQANKFSQTDIEEKAKNQLVSYVDKQAEALIVKDLEALLPEAGFICEEETINKQGEYQWIIDPLDGTTNFLHQLPAYCVSIGLYKEKEGLIGVVYDIKRDECYHAYKGGGAFMNNEKIAVSGTDDFSQILVGTGFPYTDFSWADNYLEFLKFLMKETRGIRRFGSAALDLCWVACGKYDVFYEHSLQPWDVAGGAVIVAEAGGLVCDFKHEDNYLHYQQIVASNPIVFEQFMSQLQKNI
ncbi:UNVERIFIED_CONTAM: hypothetical protein GTU68_013438 [Idotea baltica]|nr:hypothetical protein [Idotea baltica]